MAPSDRSDQELADELDAATELWNRIHQQVLRRGLRVDARLVSAAGVPVLETYTYRRLVPAREKIGNEIEGKAREVLTGGDDE